MVSWLMPRHGIDGADFAVRMTAVHFPDLNGVFNKQVRVKLAHVAAADNIRGERELVGTRPLGNGNPFVGDYD
jgi:hypothetical protein